MSAVAVIGTQWGDEGKGKIVDVLSERYKVVARFQGANNAGHTLVINGKKTIVHTLPSGIVRKGTINLVLPYVLCDPEVLVSELEIARACGSEVFIDPKCSVILPIHRQIDELRENSRKAHRLTVAGVQGAIGTTKCGVGPGYEDFVSRRGVRIGDLRDSSKVVKKLRAGNYYKEKCAIAKMHGGNPLSEQAVVSWCELYSSRITPFIADTAATLQNEYELGNDVVFEGAQGVMLGVINGVQPYCTSSICVPQVALAQCYIRRFDRVYGVVKAYATRVGAGPFPTELFGPLGDELREKGGEYGATTGRPRRCGWLDLPAVRYACERAGVTHLVISKLDVLSGLGKINVATDYYGLGAWYTFDDQVMNSAKVEYTELQGWDEDISLCRKTQDLPLAAREYVRCIEQYLSIPVQVIGVGPGREEVIRLAKQQRLLFMEEDK